MYVHELYHFSIVGMHISHRELILQVHGIYRPPYTTYTVDININELAATINYLHLDAVTRSCVQIKWNINNLGGNY